MSQPFNPATGLIIVRATLEGAANRALLRLVLDTGSSHTVIDQGILKSTGVLPQASAVRFLMRTAGGTRVVRRVTARKLTALGRSQTDFPVMTYAIPIALGIDGMLGLDFLRGQALTIDFRQGLITLA